MGECQTVQPALDRRGPTVRLVRQFSPEEKHALTIAGPVCTFNRLDFDEMTGSDPVNLFGAHTRKHVAENASSFGVLEALLELAEGVDYLYLWLDCDREGENICFEVITVLRSAGYFDDNGSIFRAEFSALTPVDIKRAFHHPGKPDAAKANAVDAGSSICCPPPPPPLSNREPVRENTDGVGAPHHLLPSMHADARAILMPSLFHRPGKNWI